MSTNRDWMYNHLDNGLVRLEFAAKVKEFMAFAKSQIAFLNEKKIRCPCDRIQCRNRAFHDEETVEYHLVRYGFVKGHYRWYLHGEEGHRHVEEFQQTRIKSGDNDYEMPTIGCTPSCHEMERYLVGPSLDLHCVEEPPNPQAQQLYNMIEAANKPLWSGCEDMTKLSAISRLLMIKSNHHISEQACDDILQLLKDSLPTDNTLVDSFSSIKQLMQGLGLPIEEIDCCKSQCMIYWGDDMKLTACKFCGESRYTLRQGGSNRNSKLQPCKKMYYFPLAPRLQRLFASEATAKQMRWHGEHVMKDSVMQHCSDSIAWKHFNDNNRDFSAEIRNVRLGLCTNGFQPFGQSRGQYSSWPVILTPYNLPPSMCMKKEFMFLTVIIPGLTSPMHQIDVFLQPLVKELQDLWHNGVQTYDISTRTNFLMRAALMWTVSDFPAYSMLSGWNTYGMKACPYCMEDTNAFHLKNEDKTSWFDCHRRFLPQNASLRTDKDKFRTGKTVRNGPPPIKSGEDILKEIERLGLMKVTEIGAESVNGRISKVSGWEKRSIFWDLPYWKTNLIRHNLDVMYIEKNVFNNIFNTILSVPGKSRDNSKSRQDVRDICNRPSLHFDPVSKTYPRSCYTLDKRKKQVLCD